MENSPTGIRHFGEASDNGLSRIPRPAAKIIATELRVPPLFSFEDLSNDMLVITFVIFLQTLLKGRENNAHILQLRVIAYKIDVGEGEFGNVKLFAVCFMIIS